MRILKYDYALQAKKTADKALLVNSIDKNPESIGGAFYFEKLKIIRSAEFEKEDILVIEI